MNLDEIAAFHNLRNELFAKRDGSRLMLDQATYRTMCDALPEMDAERATRALRAYREAKPYKGFYWDKFTAHYDGDRDRTGARPEAAPACSADLERLLADAARREQRHEVEDFEQLPAEFVRQCATKFADWGIQPSERNRAWRILCIDAWHGRDVEPYRIERRNTLKPIDIHREEMNRQNIIERLRRRIWELEMEIDTRSKNEAEPLPF